MLLVKTSRDYHWSRLYPRDPVNLVLLRKDVQDTDTGYKSFDVWPKFVRHECFESLKMFASLAHFAAPTGLGIKRSNTTQPVLEKQCRDPNRFLGKIDQQKRLQLDSHLQDERCERSYNQHKSGSNAFFVHGLVAVVTVAGELRWDPGDWPAGGENHGMACGSGAWTIPQEVDLAMDQYLWKYHF